ncbi:MAG: 23S rRNA (adenine(2030)-N(6))-methyltransferase RlmJ [Alphaproteobacteria bacterium]|nr:23S rRNA (adenine(2030)-N(6))-methyltransferase RlmJ [Alphaproteobacteria bacterium]
MNYRHAYHAGNHTEVFKHAVLALILDRLRQKPAPFMVLDTHAGLGLYDLRSPEALKTGEAAAGIGAVLASGRELPGPYLSVVRPFTDRGLYPGSPAIAAAMLRAHDRIAACELHPEDVAVLRRNFRDDRRVAVHHRNGYEALLALIPPPERRGLVFVDPPYEKTDEAERLGRTLAAAVRKWPTGIFAAWYPIKDDAIGRAIARPLVEAGVPGCLKVELLRHRPDGERLAGSGILLINPPWQLDDDLRRLGGELLAALSAGQGRSTVDSLTMFR